MPPVILPGQTTGNIETAQRKVDMANTIYLLQPEETPFATLVRRLSKRATINPVFDWLEDEAVPYVDAINNGAGYLSTDTAIVVDNGGYFAANDIVKVFRTGETMRVTGVATNTLTVTRSWGATAAAALLDNDVLMIMGPAYAEGAGKGAARMTKKVKKTNYTQIFRQPIKLTGTLEASGLYGTSSERSFQRAKKAKEHNWAIERAFFFGEKNEDLSGDPIRSTGGLHEFITTNVTSLANDAALTLAALDLHLESLFAYGSGERWAFVSPHMASVINALGQAKLQIQQHEVGRAGDVKFGLHVTDYLSPFGIVHFVMAKMLKDFVAATTPFIAGKVMYSLDFDPEDGVAYRFLSGRDTSLRTNIQANDVDAWEDEYLTECGLQVAQERKHGRLQIYG